MDIHQMQLAYDQRADRLLWQLRTRDGAVVGVWLTRRMVARLWPPFQQWVMQVPLQQTVQSGSIVLPQAREMLAEVARQRPLPGTDFRAPFDAQAVSRPLGPEPLLPDQIELMPLPPAQGKGLQIRIREAGGRSLELGLSEEMSTALMRLMESAIAASAWFDSGLVAAAPGPQGKGPDSGALN
jgi:hypothetical protein